MRPMSLWLRIGPTATLPLFLLATACAAPAQGGPFAFHETEILGTSLELLVTAPTKADADKARVIVVDEIERLRKILSTYQRDGELAKINGTREAVKVSPELIEVLRLYEGWQGKSNGAFSGQLGGIVAVWKQAAADGKLPDRAKLQALATECKKPLWKIDEKASTVMRLSEQSINIDSLGKGFIVSQAASLAKSKVPSLRGLLLNIGGDISVIGTCNLDKVEPWTIAVANPAHPDENSAPITELKLTSMAVATSGGYERGYKVGDKRFSHLIDPRTGWAMDPAEATGVASATVIAADNATANALAASLCVLKPAEGLALVGTLPGTHALIVLGNGKQMRSAGFGQFESGKGTATTTAAPATQAAKNPWPKDYVVTLLLKVLPNTGKKQSGRPYLAVWIEDEKGNPVDTLAVWGNEAKYLRSLSGWWKIGKGDGALVRSVTRATRPAGQYTFTWDGTDQAGNAVSQGKYTLNVEVCYEKGGHSQKSAVITCGADKATATLASTGQFEEAAVTYATKGTAGVGGTGQ